jgi:hypothetical protein
MADLNCKDELLAEKLSLLKIQLYVDNVITAKDSMT